GSDRSGVPTSVRGPRLQQRWRQVRRRQVAVEILRQVEAQLPALPRWNRRATTALHVSHQQAAPATLVEGWPDQGPESVACGAVVQEHLARGKATVLGDRLARAAEDLIEVKLLGACSSCRRAGSEGQPQKHGSEHLQAYHPRLLRWLIGAERFKSRRKCRY